VGWVGRLDPVKDPDTFLRAAARVAHQLPEIEFIMAAAPANLNHDQIRRRVKALGLENRLTLLPRGSDIETHMAAMDLGVITSTGSEVISRVLLEFLALGKPVLGTPVNAIGEIIEPGVNGELFPPGDDRALARLMTAWAQDPGQRIAYAAGARQTYAHLYGEDPMYRQYREVLAAAAGCSPDAPPAARPR
ncbi:MAG: glycosyltransferase family 4 protein, partial [Desulfobacterales bacterium]